MARRREQQRQQLEQRLGGEGSLLEQVANSTRTAILVVDAEGHALLHNPAFTELFGEASALDGPAEGWPQRLGLFTDEHGREPLHGNRLPLLQALHGEQGAGCEVFARNAHAGAGTWVSCQGRPLTDSEGRVCGALLSVEDIGERRADETNRRIVEGLFEHSLEGMVVTDRHNRILRVNRAFSAITGYAPEEALGKTPSMLGSGWHDKAFYRKLWAALESEGVWQGEIWDRRRSGEVYAEWLTICALRDGSGRATHYLGMFYDVTEKKRAEERIAHLAYHDHLTDLPNRRLFEERLVHAIEGAQRAGTGLAVMFVDLDRFKPVNDSFGHKAGDVLLKTAGQRFAERVCADDTVARLGGDEFALLIEGAGQEAAAATARKILAALEQPIDVGGHEVFVGASIGISTYPHDGRSAEELLKHADVAMYRAKSAGRHTYRFFLPTMNAGVADRLVLEIELRRAIEHGQLELHYQPQFRLADGSLVGMEALLRWRHPERGLIPPGEFIPIAEESGLIGPIGEWVLATACRQRVAWRDRLPQDVTVAVNVSARQFNAELPETVQRILDETGLEASRLELEMTESMVMARVEESVAVFRRLRGMGVQLSVDDFGTGYSSLSYLKRFPLNKLKVDRSFVVGLPEREEDAAIAKTIIGIAKSLGLTVIAEGVENRAQLRFLRAQGCDQVQGFYCGRPQPPEAAVMAAGIQCVGALHSA